MASFCFISNPKQLPAASIIDTSMLILRFYCSDTVTFCYLIGAQRTECQEQADVKAVFRTFPALGLGLPCETRGSTVKYNAKMIFYL